MNRYGQTGAWFIVASAVAAGALLTGCQADSGKQDPGMSARSSAIVPAARSQPSPAAAPVPADARPVIVCFGDSITAGYGVDPALTYPADLQHNLDAAGYRYRVLNMGVSGETTKDGLARVSAVLARKPDWVVVEFGGNDGLRGLPPADSQRNLSAIVSALRAGGAHVLLAAITLPTQYGPDYINHFQAIFPTVAKQENVPLLPFTALARGVYGVPGNIQEDGIHPTASGDAVLARNVQAALAPLLRR